MTLIGLCYTVLIIQHNSMYGNVPGLLSQYSIGLDGPGYSQQVCAYTKGYTLMVQEYH